MYLGATHPLVQARQEIEASILEAVIDLCLQAGHAIAVHDGEEGHKKTTDKNAILRHAFETDEESLFVYEPTPVAEGSGWVCVGGIEFVYGNDGYDVINDYTGGGKLEKLIKPALTYAESYENWNSWDQAKFSSLLVAWAERKQKMDELRGRAS